MKIKLSQNNEYWSVGSSEVYFRIERPHTSFEGTLEGTLVVEADGLEYFPAEIITREVKTLEENIEGIVLVHVMKKSEKIERENISRAKLSFKVN